MSLNSKKAPGGAFKTRPGGPIQNTLKKGCSVNKATPVVRQGHALLNLVEGAL